MRGTISSPVRHGAGVHEVRTLAPMVRPSHCRQQPFFNPDTMLQLSNAHNGAEVLLVGTQHSSSACALEVRQAIRRVRPDTVMLELCPLRAELLKLLQWQASGSSALHLAHSGGVFHSGGHADSNAAAPLIRLCLAGAVGAGWVGTDGAGARAADMWAALEEADAAGARLVWGDRAELTTLARGAAGFAADVLGLPFRRFHPHEPAVPAESAVQAHVSKPRESLREARSWCQTMLPSTTAALTDERDEVLTTCLRGLQGRVVGVVGLAHLDGIERRWRTLEQGLR